MTWTLVGSVTAFVLAPAGQSKPTAVAAIAVCFGGLIPRVLLYLGGLLVPSPVRRRRAAFAQAWSLLLPVSATRG